MKNCTISKKTLDKLGDIVIDIYTKEKIIELFECKDGTIEVEKYEDQKSLLSYCVEQLDINNEEEQKKMLHIIVKILKRLEKEICPVAASGNFRDVSRNLINEMRTASTSFLFPLPSMCNEILENASELRKIYLRKNHQDLIAFLKQDGFEYKDGEITPIDINLINFDTIKGIIKEENLGEYIETQINRMESNWETDPDLALGTAKETIESCCKTILTYNGINILDDEDFSDLSKKTREILKLLPEEVSKHREGSEAIRAILGNLSSITHQVNILRKIYGTGHGKIADFKHVTPAVACLTVESTIAFVTFIYSVFKESRQ